jgi:hypothetical protein
MPAGTVVSTSGVACTPLVAEGRFLTMTAESVSRFAGRAVRATSLPANLPATYRPLPVGIITLKNCTLKRVAAIVHALRVDFFRAATGSCGRTCRP